MKTTFEVFLTFLNVANAYVATEKKTKLAYAIQKVIKQNKPAIDHYNETLEDARIDNAAVDDKGILLTDEKTGAYKYTKEGTKALNQAAKELKAKEYQFETFFATELPKDLTDDLKEALEGFVIKPEKKKA